MAIGRLIPKTLNQNGDIFYWNTKLSNAGANLTEGGVPNKQYGDSPA